MVCGLTERECRENLKKAYRLMQEANKARGEISERYNKAWGHILLGTWPAEGTKTDERQDQWTEELPGNVIQKNAEAGYERHRIVPLDELAPG